MACGFEGEGILHHAQLHFPDRAGVALAQRMSSTEGKWLIFAPKAGAVMQLPETAVVPACELSLIRP